MTREKLAPFDDDLFGAVEAEVDSDRLAALAREHQAGIRERPGVDNIVYEWRHQLPRDPLLLRTTAVYVLALPDRVWAEFLDQLGLTGPEADALRELHHRQACRYLEGADTPRATDALDAAAMVISRP